MNRTSGKKSISGYTAGQQLAAFAALFIFCFQISAGFFHHHQTLNSSGISLGLAGFSSSNSEAFNPIPGGTGAVKIAAVISCSAGSGGHQESTCPVCIALHQLRSASFSSSLPALLLQSVESDSLPPFVAAPVLAELRPAAAPRAPPIV